MTVIDGTRQFDDDRRGWHIPDAVAVNPVTNKIYVANQISTNVTVIDGTN